MHGIPSEWSWITASATFGNLCSLFENIFGEHHKLQLTVTPVYEESDGQVWRGLKIKHVISAGLES